MNPELGHFALILAMLVALVLATLPMVGAARGNVAWMCLARPAAFLHGMLLIGLPLADIRLCRQRLQRALRGGKLQQRAAADLPHGGGMGRP